MNEAGDKIELEHHQRVHGPVLRSPTVQWCSQRGAHRNEVKIWPIMVRNATRVRLLHTFSH